MWIFKDTFLPTMTHFRSQSNLDQKWPVLSNSVNDIGIFLKMGGGCRHFPCSIVLFYVLENLGNFKGIEKKNL